MRKRAELRNIGDTYGDDFCDAMECLLRIVDGKFTAAGIDLKAVDRLTIRLIPSIKSSPNAQFLRLWDAWVEVEYDDGKPDVPASQD